MKKVVKISKCVYQVPSGKYVVDKIVSGIRIYKTFTNKKKAIQFRNSFN